MQSGNYMQTRQENFGGWGARNGAKIKNKLKKKRMSFNFKNWHQSEK